LRDQLSGIVLDMQNNEKMGSVLRKGRDGYVSNVKNILIDFDTSIDIKSGKIDTILRQEVEDTV
jgi:hypothetical protein